MIFCNRGASFPLHATLSDISFPLCISLDTMVGVKPRHIPTSHYGINYVCDDVHQHPVHEGMQAHLADRPQ